MHQVEVLMVTPPPPTPPYACAKKQAFLCVDKGKEMDHNLQSW